jgi:hypothetical protein
VLSAINPLGKYAAIVSSIIALFWIGLTGLVDSGIVKGDATLLNPISVGLIGVIFGTAVATNTINGSKAAIEDLKVAASDHTAQIATLATAVVTAQSAAVGAQTSATNAQTSANANAAPCPEPVIALPAPAQTAVVVPPMAKAPADLNPNI